MEVFDMRIVILLTLICAAFANAGELRPHDKNDNDFRFAQVSIRFDKLSMREKGPGNPGVGAQLTIPPVVKTEQSDISALAPIPINPVITPITGMPPAQDLPNPKETVKKSIYAGTGIGAGTGALFGGLGGVVTASLLTKAAGWSTAGAVMTGIGAGLGIALAFTALGFIIGSLVGMMKVAETIFP